jgi:hypothetical protein
MIQKLEPNKNVIKALSSHIQKTQYQWSRVPSGSVTRELFDAQELPTRDLTGGYFLDGSTHTHLAIMAPKHELNPLAELVGANENTNLIVYGANSCMGWHTNSDMPGDRIYYTFTLGKAIFRYVNQNGQIIDDIDNSGWTVRKFPVQKDPLLWHTIWTEKIRFSFGFWVKNVS